MPITIKLKQKKQRRQDPEYFLSLDKKFFQEVITIFVTAILILLFLFCFYYGRNEISLKAIKYVILKGGFSYLKGNAALQKGNLQKAEKFCLQGIKLNPVNILNALCLVKIYKAHKNEKKSFVWYQWITYEYPKFATAYLEIGKHFYRQKKYKQALKNFLLVKELVPWKKDGYYYLGLAYENLQMQPNALEVYEEGENKVYADNKKITKKLKEKRKYLEKKLFKK